MKQTVCLNELKFQAYHGLYPEEKVLGNTFLVNLMLERQVGLVDFASSKIEDTVDYTMLYTIVKDRMGVPSDLLETVVGDIITECKEKIASMTYIRVSLKKKNPPFGGDCGSAEIVAEYWV